MFITEFLKSRYICPIILFILLLFALSIRIQGVATLPNGQFTEKDAYLYYHQAEIIAEQGSLPPRDMHRWLPLGRDNEQIFPLYAYAIAYTHKAIGWVFPKLTLYHIQVYAAATCFTFGLGVLSFFLVRAYGVTFAAIVVLLLATLPGSIERSAAGFGDRDAWCWMLGILVVTSYLYKEGMEPGWRRWIATALAGFTVFLGGMSWEGFGFFALMIVAVELWKFCSTDIEQHLKEYLLYILMFVPWLYLISPAYRNGYGFSTHVTALMLFPSLVLFAIRTVRYLLLKYVEYFHPYARRLAWGLTLLAIATGVGYICLRAHTFENTAFTFRESQLMQTIGELKDPHWEYWTSRYGSVFILGSLGVIVASLRLWKWFGVPLVFCLAIFTATTFFREAVGGWIGDDTCNTLFFASFGMSLFSLSIPCLRKENAKKTIIIIALLAWYLLWVGLSRGGKRHDFFIGVPLAFFTAALLHFLSNTLSSKLRHSEYTTDKFREVFTHTRLKTGCIAVLLAFILFWPPAGGHARLSLHAATQMRNAQPGYSRVYAAFLWMKKILLKQVEKPDTVVVAAHWDYGCQLNVLAGVKTINDNDTFLPHWIHLYNKHIHQATSEREVLEFLKTHEVTHLMLTDNDPKETFLTGDLSDAFFYVYPSKNKGSSRIKIWEIRYPPDIKADPKYLATQPEKTDDP